MTETYNPFVQILKCFEGFSETDTYYKLRRQSSGSRLLCALIVSALLSVLIFGIGAGKLCANDTIKRTLQSMPDFNYSNGILDYSERFETISSGTYVLLDTSVPYYYTGTDDKGYIGAVNVESAIQQLATQNGIKDAMFCSESNIVRVQFTVGQVSQMNYSEVGSILHIYEFSKQSINNGYRGFIVKWAAIIGLLSIPFLFAGLFISALLYSLVTLIIKAIVNNHDTFDTIYWISFYMNIALAICSAFLKNFVPSGPLNITILAVFIFLMSRTLKNGDSYNIQDFYAMPNNPGSDGNRYAQPANPYKPTGDPVVGSVIEDDFEEFMSATEPVKTTTSQSESSSQSSQTNFSLGETATSSDFSFELQDSFSETTNNTTDFSFGTQNSFSPETQSSPDSVSSESEDNSFGFSFETQNNSTDFSFETKERPAESKTGLSLKPDD